jgi:hypothetical protein
VKTPLVATVPFHQITWGFTRPRHQKKQTYSKSLFFSKSPDKLFLESRDDFPFRSFRKAAQNNQYLRWQVEKPGQIPGKCQQVCPNGGGWNHQVSFAIRQPDHQVAAQIETQSDCEERVAAETPHGVKRIGQQIGLIENCDKDQNIIFGAQNGPRQQFHRGDEEESQKQNRNTESLFAGIEPIGKGELGDREQGCPEELLKAQERQEQIREHRERHRKADDVEIGFFFGDQKHKKKTKNNGKVLQKAVRNIQPKEKKSNILPDFNG